MTYPTVTLDVAFATAPFATPTYTSIPAQDLTGLSITIGRKSELDALTPATGVFELDNAARNYDPRAAGGAYYPNVTPGKRVRLTLQHDEQDGAAVVSYVGAGALASGNNTSLTPALPSGLKPYRDLLVCLASINTGTVNTPDGWFVIASTGNLSLLGRYVIGGETAPTITFTGGSSGDTTLAQLAAFRDVEVDQAQLVIGTPATQSNASAQNIAVPAHTVAEGGVVLVAARKADDWTSVAPLSGQFFSEAIDASSTTGNDAGHVLDYRVQTGALNVSATSFTVTGGAAAVSRSIVAALRPYRGRTARIYHGWADGWPQRYGFRTGTATLRSSGAFKHLARKAMPDPYEAAVLADSPTAWYRLSDTSGTTLTDSSGNGLHGAWVPNLDQVDTTDGLVVSSDSAVELVASPAWATGRVPAAAVPSIRPLSVELWLLLEKPPAALEDPLLLDAQLFSGLIVRGGPNLRVWAEGNTYPGALDFIVVDDPNLLSAAIAIGTTAFEERWYSPCDGRPHHIVATINAAGNLLCIYVDGVDRAPYNDFVGTLAAIPAFEDIEINPGGAWQGKAIMDEVAFYDAELSQSQIEAHYVAGSSPWDGDTTGERISQVLDLIDWPADLRDLDDGQLELGPVDSTGAACLEVIEVTTATEQGWTSEAHDDDGGIRFVDRGGLLTELRSTAPQTLFSDNATDLSSNDAVPATFDLATDDRPAANVVTVKRPGGSVTVADQASVDAYGEVPITVDTLLDSDVKARNLAGWLLGERAQLFTRVNSVTITPSRHTGTAAALAWRTVLTRREGDRVRVVHTPTNSGTAIDQELWITGIDHTAGQGAEEWTTTYHLTPAITTDYWVVGVSQLGVNTRLAY